MCCHQWINQNCWSEQTSSVFSPYPNPAWGVVTCQLIYFMESCKFSSEYICKRLSCPSRNYRPYYHEKKEFNVLFPGWPICIKANTVVELAYIVRTTAQASPALYHRPLYVISFVVFCPFFSSFGAGREWGAEVKEWEFALKYARV